MKKKIFLVISFIFVIVIGFAQKENVLRPYFEITRCCNIDSLQNYEVRIINTSQKKIQYFLGIEFFEDNRWREMDGDIFSDQKEPIYRTIRSKGAASVNLAGTDLDKEFLNTKIKYRFKVYYLNPFDVGYFKYNGGKNKFLGTHSSVTKSFQFCKTR